VDPALTPPSPDPNPASGPETPVVVSPARDSLEPLPKDPAPVTAFLARWRQAEVVYEVVPRTARPLEERDRLDQEDMAELDRYMMEREKAISDYEQRTNKILLYEPSDKELGVRSPQYHHPSRPVVDEFYLTKAEAAAAAARRPEFLGKRLELEVRPVAKTLFSVQLWAKQWATFLRGHQVPSFLRVAGDRNASSADRVAAVEALGALRLSDNEKEQFLKILTGLAVRREEPENPVLTGAATSVLAAFGPAAVPALRQGLQDHNGSVRFHSARILGWLGATAAPATPELLKGLNDPLLFVRSASATALAQIEPPSLSDRQWLDIGLATSNDTAQRRAVEALGKVGKEALPPVLRAFADGDWTANDAARQLLGRAGAAGRALVPGLLQALDAPAPATKAPADTADRLRIPAQRALLALGNTAFPELLSALKSGPPLVREHVAEVLGRMNPEKGVQAALLSTAKDDEDASVRKAAAAALRRMEAALRRMQKGADAPSDLPPAK
jgi:HEAT repeat protein